MFDPWVWKIPWRREWLPTPVLFPGEFHGKRSLAGYSLLGHKESDTTQWLTLDSLGLSTIFWETSMPWEPSGKRSKYTGWSAKEETRQKSKWTSIPMAATGAETREALFLGMMVPISGLHAYCLELVSMDLEHLRPFWWPGPPLRDPPCTYQNGPLRAFALDLWSSGLILVSAMAECNMCMRNHLCCCHSWRKKMNSALIWNIPNKLTNGPDMGHRLIHGPINWAT